MRIIMLPRNSCTVVDDEDFDAVMLHKWYVGGMGYVLSTRRLSMNGLAPQYIYLHRFLMNTPIGMDTDHISGFKLDNRRCNLRICTTGQNCRNSGLRKNNTTGFKGVLKLRDTYRPHLTHRYRARITFNRVERHLGVYLTAEAAYAAYVAAAEQMHGEFANVGGAQ